MKAKKTNKIDCKLAARYICENLDEKTNSPICRQIKKHLKECPSCSAYLSSVKKTVTLYRAYPVPKFDRKCHENLLSLISKMPKRK